MKNIFKKFLITSLSTACLLANQANGMASSEIYPNLEKSSLQRSQISPFVSELSKILELDQEQENRLTASLSQQNPEEFAYSFLGTSGFGVSSLSGSMGLSPEEKEIRRLISKSADTDFFPLLHPSRIMDLINGILVPKYAGVLNDRFSKRPLDIGEDDFDDVFEFLQKNKYFILCDLCSPSPMILFLKLITQQPNFNRNIHNPINMSHHYNYPPIQPMYWMNFLGIKNGQLIVKMDDFYNHLKSTVSNQQYYHGGMGGMSEQQDKKNLKVLKATFNE